MTDEEQRQHICIDCAWHQPAPSMSDLHPNYCVHLTPEYWEARGYRRGWGDAAVMGWPTLEILRKAEGDTVTYIVLNGELRRPVVLYMQPGGGSWGSY